MRVRYAPPAAPGRTWNECDAALRNPKSVVQVTDIANDVRRPKPSLMEPLR